MLLLAVIACARPAAARSAQPRFGLWPLSENGALDLVRHDVQIAIEHPVATTVITQEFENPTSRSLEAHYYYPVPLGATVAGLALWVNGERREARVLERQRATEIYEGIVRQKRDPALLERLSGNLFRIRIFPVLPRRRTRVELRFVQIVEQDTPGRYRYVLAPPPGPPVDVLRVGVALRTPFAIASASLAGLMPGATPLRRLGASRFGHALGAAQHTFARSLELRYRAAAPPRTPAVVAQEHAGERLFVAEVPAPRAVTARRRRVVVLVDRSRSVHRQLPLARDIAAAIRAQLTSDDALAIVPFDLLPGPVALRPPREAPLELEPGALGTAFIPAFEAALAVSPTHVVCITDGGDRYHQAELEALARLLHDRGGTVVSTVALPNATDEEALQDLARVTGGLHQRVREMKLDALHRLAARIVAAPARTAAWLQPDGLRLQILRAEAHRLVVAGAVPAASADKPAAIRLSGSTATTRLTLPTGKPACRAVGALWANAAIDAAMTRIKLFGEEPALVDRIIALSKAHGVTSEYTALLATETDADYARPTSGQRWQRRPARTGDELPTPSFHSTPEPHEILLVAVALLLLLHARRRGWLPG